MMESTIQQGLAASSVHAPDTLAKLLNKVAPDFCLDVALALPLQILVRLRRLLFRFQRFGPINRRNAQASVPAY